MLGLQWKVRCKEGRLWEVEGTRWEERTSRQDSWSSSVGRKSKRGYYQGKMGVDRSILLDGVLCKIL